MILYSRPTHVAPSPRSSPFKRMQQKIMASCLAEQFCDSRPCLQLSTPYTKRTVCVCMCVCVCVRERERERERLNLAMAVTIQPGLEDATGGWQLCLFGQILFFIEIYIIMTKGAFGSDGDIGLFFKKKCPESQLPSV